MFNFFGKKVFQLTDNQGRDWFLHSQTIELKNGNGKSTTYFFAREKRKNACDMPEGYTVMSSPKTGMPMLRKKR